MQSSVLHSLVFPFLFAACSQPSSHEVGTTLLDAMGNKYKMLCDEGADAFEVRIQADSSDIEVLLGKAEMRVLT